MTKDTKVGKVDGMIGLEIHTYVVTKEKLFCRCKASRERGLKGNTYICPICTGQPGAKPMAPNRVAVEKAIQIALMLGCKVNSEFWWQRKHYDWPDLPKGYQTTISGSYAMPVGEKGNFHGIGIWSMHLEEDPAAWDPETGEIDYNRSGLPLVEIVTAPDFKNSEEVVEWLGKLIHALAYLKAADSNAGVKADVNVSIRGKTERVEIKNINSLENVARAIEYELERQSKEGSVRETRRFDDKKGITVRMRGKEDQEDYRFIPEPDLKVMKIGDKWIKDIKGKIPEMPEVKLEKLIKKYKIDEQNAKILSKNLDVVEFFERVAEKVDGQYALSWVNIELLRLLNDNKTTLDKVDIKVEHFADLVKFVKEGKITTLQGKEILRKFYPKSFAPEVKEGKITDVKEIEKVVDKVLKSNKQAVDSYKAGEKKSFEFLMGMIMKETQKRADFSIARKVLEKKLV